MGPCTNDVINVIFYVWKLPRILKISNFIIQTQNKGTRFVEYISLEVLPQLHCITDPDVQSQVLKTLGEACMNSSEVKQPDIGVNNIYQKLMVG